VERLVVFDLRSSWSADFWQRDSLFRAGQAVGRAFKHRWLADRATLFAQGGSRKRTILPANLGFAPSENSAAGLQYSTSNSGSLSAGAQNGCFQNFISTPPSPVNQAARGAPGHHHIALGLTGFPAPSRLPRLLARLAPPSRYQRTSDCGGSRRVAERPVGREGIQQPQGPRRDPPVPAARGVAVGAALKGRRHSGLPEQNRRRLPINSP